MRLEFRCFQSVYDSFIYSSSVTYFTGMNRVPAYVAKYDRESLIILIVKEGVNRLDGIKSGRNFAPSFGNDGTEWKRKN